MEALTRMVVDSLARHGLDRPIDPRRLQWSRWFRCESTHSLLVVPSKPGIFALAEEVMDLGPTKTPATMTDREGHDFSRAETTKSGPALASEASVRRMLAVVQFAEDDDMAFTLDRMFTRVNPMRNRLASGQCWLRFVVIDDQAQRRSICATLNQWIVNSAEKATSLPADFQSSLEMAPVTARVGRTLLSDSASSIPKAAQAPQQASKPDPIRLAPTLTSGAAKNLHCSQPLPSGF
jgi:hypothetical protein